MDRPALRITAAFPHHRPALHASAALVLGLLLLVCACSTTAAPADRIDDASTAAPPNGGAGRAGGRPEDSGKDADGSASPTDPVESEDASLDAQLPAQPDAADAAAPLARDAAADTGGPPLVPDVAGARLQGAFIWAAPNTAQAVVFRKTVVVGASPAPARVHIFADSYYALWINGHYLLTGPSRFDPKAPQFDTVDVTDALHTGTNTVAVLAYANPDQISGQRMKHAGGMTLWMEGSGLDVASDTTWKASANTRFGAPKVTWSSVLELVDARREYDCLAEQFDDAAWPAAVAVNGSSWGPVKPRDIPLLDEKVLTARLPFTPPADTGSFVATFDKSYTVTVQLDFEAAAGTTVEVFGNKYTARAGRQVYRTIDTFGFGLDGTPTVPITTSGSIRVHGIQFTNRVYPFKTAGAFASSDPRLDRLWEIAVRTIEQVSEDGYEDCPWERAEWMGDGAIVEYPVTRVALVGPDNSYGDPRLIRKMLKNIAESQQSDGRLKAHAPSDRFDIHGYIEDYACLWIQTVRQYFDHTGDQAFVESIWPVLVKQLALFASVRQPSGLARGREFTIFDNPLAYQVVEGATLNAFLYRALRDSAYLATQLGRPTEANAYAVSATALAKAYNTALWDGTGYKASTTVTATGAGRWYASMIALGQGIVSEDRVQGLRQTLFANASALSATLYPYTHTWLFADLYDMHGAAADQAVLDRMRARWANTFSASNVGMVTDESLGPRKFHNFGAAPAYFLSAYVLGVTLDGALSNDRLIIAPRLGDLTSAKGTVVTEHGLVPVSWARDPAGVLTFSFTVPPGKRAQVRLADDNSPSAAGLTVNGQPHSHTVEGRYVVFEVAAGTYSGVLTP